MCEHEDVKYLIERTKELGVGPADSPHPTRGKHVHSADPRKASVVAALKAKSGGTKVTLLREVAPHTFTGSCLRPGARKGNGKRGYEQLGEFTVEVRS